MFNPSQADVRRFFCEAWSKGQAGLLLSPLERLAVDWIQQHPEYHADLSDVQRAIDTDYDGHDGRENPFLHLSMHLSISEQVSINQPAGIKPAVEQLAQRHGDLHRAHHDTMEALGQMLWQSQRQGLAPDAQTYVNEVLARARMGSAD